MYVCISIQENNENDQKSEARNKELVKCQNCKLKTRYLFRYQRGFQRIRCM